MQHSRTVWHAGTVARLHILAEGEHRFVVFVAADERDATPAALTRPGGLAALITHDPGLTWPDKRGESLARAMLEADGVAALGFARLGDASAAQGRIKGGGG
jgi:hypothetical protein